MSKPTPKLPRKIYEKELVRLQTELVDNFVVPL